jgi:hypothetical protein
MHGCCGVFNAVRIVVASVLKMLLALLLLLCLNCCSDAINDVNIAISRFVIPDPNCLSRFNGVFGSGSGCKKNKIRI